VNLGRARIFVRFITLVAAENVAYHIFLLGESVRRALQSDRSICMAIQAPLTERHDSHAVT
jgi:hypothetical protein